MFRRGELSIGNLDVDALLLIAEVDHLGDARHAQQLRAQRVGVVMQLRAAKSRRRSSA